MQGTGVQCLVWENPTCLRETQPGYWASTLKPPNYNYWNYWGAHPTPQLLKPECPRAYAPQQDKPRQYHNEKAIQHNEEKPTVPTHPTLLQLEKATMQQGRPSTDKNKQINLKKKKPIWNSAALKQSTDLSLASTVFGRNRPTYSL